MGCRVSGFWAVLEALTFAGAFLLYASGQTAGAIVARDSISFSGNNVIADSFNSADTNFSTGGLYDPAKARDNGDVICNGTIASSISIGNASIYGHVVTGSNGTASVGSQGGIGSHAWQASNNGIEPNGMEGQIWYSHIANFGLPDVFAPYGSGLAMGPAADIVTGNPGNYVTNHYNHVLLSGDYYYSGALSGKTIVLGQARLYLPNGLAGTENFTVATNATLALYVGGSSCSLGGGVINQDGKANSFRLYCLPSVISVSFPAISAFAGVIYAPEAALSVSGGGSTVYDLSGIMIARSLTASGHVRFHFDEALGGVSSHAPYFVLQPQSQSAVAGQGVTFTVGGNGATPMTFQWRFNGTGIPGATNSSLTLTNVSGADAGSYSVVASNSFGSASSSNAVLTVNYPPAVLKQPVSQTAVLNSNVVFAVTATGTGPLAYQWRFNGQNVLGETNSSINISSMQPGKVGSYVAVVTNVYGGVTSAPAALSLAARPDFLWARQVTNSVDGFFWGMSKAEHMAADSSGNVAVVGNYQGWGVDFGGAMLTRSPAYGFYSFASFVCQYDQWGNFSWVRQICTNSDAGTRVAMDGSGNVYVTGEFIGTAVFGTNVLVSAGPADMFIAKYNPQGDAVWVRQIGAFDLTDIGSFYLTSSRRRAVAVDAAGNAHILSDYIGSASFGSATVSNSAAFLAKYDSAGNLLWAKPALGGKAICVGGSGAIYVACPTNGSGYSGLLAKYDSLGNLTWSRPFASARAIALDGAENIYTTGWGKGTYGDFTITYFEGWPDCFVAKCNPAGNITWVRQMGSVVGQTGMGIALDGYGNVYVAATSASTERDPALSFGSTVLTNVISLVAKYDSTGNPLWGVALPGTFQAEQAGIAVVNPGSVYLAGTFYCSEQLGNFNLVDVNRYCSADIYVTRLAGIEPPAPPQIIGQPQSQIVGAGTNVGFSVLVASGIPLGYQWSFNQTNAFLTEPNALLTLTNAQLADSGVYSVVVTNAYGSVTSSLANLTVYLTAAAVLNGPVALAGNQVQFTIGGVAGFKYAVEASTNLADWVRVVTNTSPFVFVDAQAGNYGQRFYRAVYLP
jgi:hypothetical protein